MVIGHVISRTLLGSETSGSELLWRAAITGLCIGLAQFIVFQKFLPMPQWVIWIGVVSLGWVLGWFVTLSATRESAAVTFQAFHRYAGVAIGEHLGFLFTSIWTLLPCIAVIQTGLIHPIFGWLGILPSIGVAVGMFEETGFKAAGAINAISYILWSIWLIAFGIGLLLK